MLAAMLLLAMPAQAAELAPLDFLVGHCWRGALDAQNSDTHCFRAEADKVLDRHEVLRDGKTVYWGETVYAWDAAAGRIRFTYSDPSGVVGKGFVTAIPDGLDFGTAQYKTGTDTVTISTRWLRLGADAYDAVDSAPGRPKFDRTTRYTRVD